MKITNCPITLADSEVVKDYGYNSNGKLYHSGVDIKANEVFCPCKGSIIRTGKFEDGYEVIVQYSQHIALRFSHFKEVSVREGEIVNLNRVLGLADKYIHFEYLTVEQNDGQVVRLASGYTLWKHNPYLILNRNIIFDDSEPYEGFIAISEETLAELSFGKGD